MDQGNRDTYRTRVYARHDYDACAHACKHALMLMCMHAIFWHNGVEILAKLGGIREIKISMEAGNIPLMSEHIIRAKHTS